MPLNKLKYLDSELKQIDTEHLDVRIPEDSENAKEIKEMKKEGVSLDDVKTAD
jgi:hypothetical protein